MRWYSAIRQLVKLASFNVAVYELSVHYILDTNKRHNTHGTAWHDKQGCWRQVVGIYPVSFSAPGLFYLLTAAGEFKTCIRCRRRSGPGSDTTRTSGRKSHEENGKEAAVRDTA